MTIGVFGEPKSGKTRTAFCIGQYLKSAGVKRVAVIDDETALTDKLKDLPEDLEVVIITGNVKKGEENELLPNLGTRRYL